MFPANTAGHTQVKMTLYESLQCTEAKVKSQNTHIADAWLVLLQSLVVVCKKMLVTNLMKNSHQPRSNY